MAGQSEKKRAQNASTQYKLYVQIIAALYAVYIPLRVIWCWSSFGFSTFLWLGVISVLNWVALGMVRSAWELGTPATGAQDVLFVNWAVQALCILTDKAYYLYLTIPAYLLYQYGPMLKAYMFPPQAPAEVTTEADLKRAAKKERQQAMNERRRG